MLGGPSTRRSAPIRPASSFGCSPLMCFWGATVITSLASAFPVVGNPLVTWLWGGLSVENAICDQPDACHHFGHHVLRVSSSFRCFRCCPSGRGATMPHSTSNQPGRGGWAGSNPQRNSQKHQPWQLSLPEFTRGQPSLLRHFSITPFHSKSTSTGSVASPRFQLNSRNAVE